MKLNANVAGKIRDAPFKESLSIDWRNQMISMMLSLWIAQAPSILASKQQANGSWLHGCVAAHQALFKGDTRLAAQSLKGLLLYKDTPVAVRKLIASVPKDLKVSVISTKR